jgi:DNA-binding CsgD family transcriptional regulator/tetratricopeptide (TPR) repeat protein
MTHAEFVGREPERQLLSDRLRAALGGAGQLVLLAGEPGAGKTRLAEEALAEATALGMRTGWGRATEEAGSPPYWPFRQLAQASLWDARTEGSASERFLLFEAVTDFLIASAEEQGLLIVLDDLQWADPASTHLLVHLARAMARSRLLVIGTFRHTETAGQEALNAALAALAGQPMVTRLTLAGLAEHEVAAQLAGVTGWPVPASVAAAVCKRTQGNPFFVGELGRFLTVSGEGNDLPEGVRDAVRDRLGRLSVDCRAIVAAAAVLGSELDSQAVAAATDKPIDDILHAFDQATAAGILSGGRFAHDLIREAARLDVATVDRLRLHQRMADHLRTRGDADARVSQIAYHLLESLPAGDAALAVSWAERAAVAAMAQLGWEEADALYRRALQVGQPAAPQRAQLLLARAQAQVRTYDVEGARKSLLAAAELGVAASDGEVLARASLVMEGVTDFLWADTGRRLCEQALAALPPGDSALRARLLAQRIVNDAWRSLDEVEVRSAEALAMAERVGDWRAIVEALRARQFARSGPDGASDRIALGDRLLEIGSGVDDDTALWGRLWRFDAYAQLGRIDAAEAELPHIGGLADRLRSPLPRWHSARCRAVIALARARFAEAREFGVQAVTLAERAGHHGAVFPSQGFLVTLRTITGDNVVASDDMIRAHAETVGIASMRALEASWRLAIGDREWAERVYRALPPPDAAPEFVRMSALSGVADLAVEFDDRATAAEVYRLLTPYADFFVCGGAGVVMVLGSAQLFLGTTAMICGRHDDAVRHLRAAIEVNERAGMPFYALTATYWLGVALSRRKRTGDREEAAALAASVAARAEQLGAMPLTAKAQTLAESLAGRRTGPLSRRQYEIADLVSQGLMNRQIAAALHLSERTVETHVQHILARLDFSNRSQIAAWMATERVRTESS